ncbi:CHAD domain-containing protein [Microbacterium sp.]|uniref:CHAD domain-containing protein n=1 Tax=Microbacterium sp. TaxID=51671 RepID=UPI0025D5054F|nr:CHAD domain-containing protein [Microbacterium sp.]
MADVEPVTASLGTLVQAYVDEQCGVILDARAALTAHDEAAVHPVRVAIRRLRATLSTFGSVYDEDDAARLAHELRWAGALLGVVRDLQVLAKRFADLDRTTVTESTAGAVSAVQRALGDRTEHDRASAWQDVSIALNGPRGMALFTELARWRDDPPFGLWAARPAKKARAEVEKADARVRSRLRRASAAANAGEDAAVRLMHDARKAAKRHRYAVELAEPVLGVTADEMIARRRDLQDALGAHQDAVVALGYLQRVAPTAQLRATASAFSELITRTREQVDDVSGVLSEAARIES